MNPTDWLRQRVQGFSRLSTEERQAIEDFALLWSVFECSVLSKNANTAAIVDAVGRVRDRQAISLDPFRDAIKHFRQRYYDGTQFKPAFDALHFRPPDRRSLVEAFIAEKTNNDAEIIAGLLIIVYRLRNNLFHGVKWSYKIEGQLENFNHANQALMAMMDLHGI